MTTNESSPTPQTADQYAERLLHATIDTFHLLRVYAGERLGWWRALLDGPATPAELAARTGTHERYCREWLEAEASYGTLAVEPAAGDEGRRFALPPGPAEVLTDEQSLAYLGALPRIVAAAGGQLQPLLTAFREGGGVSWDQLGDDAREAQAALNRPWFTSALGPALAGCAEIAEVLARPDVRIADVGCGAGWSTVALASAYPRAELVGIDVDAPSIEMAAVAAAAAGVADRVSFRLIDGETLGADEEFDVAFFFECLHDMPRPVQVLDAVRRSVRSDGAVVVMDEAVADELTAPGDGVENLMYGFSLFICLPDGLSSSPSVGTGTVMRPSVLAEYAEQAGFARVSVLPIENFGFFRFYRLHH